MHISLVIFTNNQQYPYLFRVSPYFPVLLFFTFISSVPILILKSFFMQNISSSNSSIFFSISFLWSFIFPLLNSQNSPYLPFYHQFTLMQSVNVMHIRSADFLYLFSYSYNYSLSCSVFPLFFNCLLVPPCEFFR